MFAAAVCNIPAPIRPSAVRNSNKDLLLSGVFLPSRTLAFLTLIKSVLRRRLDNMYTIACVSSPQGKVCDTLRNARCLHSSLRLLLPTNRALFRPRQNSFGGDFALRRFEGTPEATSSDDLLLSGALYPFLTERCVAGAREGRVFFCRKRCLYCQNRGISYRFGVERQYDDYLCACRDGVGQGGEGERSFLRHGDGHSVCGHE